VTPEIDGALPPHEHDLLASTRPAYVTPEILRDVRLGVRHGVASTRPAYVTPEINS